MEISLKKQVIRLVLIVAFLVLSSIQIQSKVIKRHYNRECADYWTSLHSLRKCSALVEDAMMAESNDEECSRYWTAWKCFDRTVGGCSDEELMEMEVYDELTEVQSLIHHHCG